MFNLVVDAGYVFFPSFFFFFILSFATILKFFVVHSRQVHLFFNNSELLAVRVKNLFLSFVKGGASKFSIHGTNEFPPYRALRFSMQRGSV